MVTAITVDNFDALVTQSTKPVVIDIYAVWCGPCQQIKPIFEAVAKEMEGAYTFASLNVDDARDIAIQYGVTSIPTIVFIKDGVVKGKEVGYIAKDMLIKKIEFYLG